MMVAMATDIRVILIKLADRLHNMRTLSALSQAEADREGEGDARDLRADRAPARHPRDQVGARGPRVRLAAPAQVPGDQGPGQPAARPARALRHRRRPDARRASSTRSASSAQISGRAKHFYSIYSKMTRKGREFNEIYDLTAMRVIVDSVKDCYGAVGVIHSLWKPLPGRFKDFVAMPQVQHVPVAAHDGDRARGNAARDPDPHARDARARRVRRRGALALQDRSQRPPRQGAGGRGEAALAALDARLAAGPLGPEGVRRPPQGRPDRQGGLRLHAAGARSSRWPPARRRSTSPTRSTPSSATAASARRSTGGSCR